MRASDPLSRFKLRRVCEVMNLKKEEFENDEQFIWRLCQAKDSGLLDMSWNEVADILNKELDMGDMPFTASAYRKPYQQAKRFHDAGVFGEIDESSEIVAQRHELEKEKVKLRDERNELKRLLREQARKESFVEQVKRAVVEFIPNRLEYDTQKKNAEVSYDGNDLVCTFFDVHAGANVDNAINVFNEEVLRERIIKYLNKIIEIRKRHNSENVVVILSELLNGYIHPTIRIENNQNLIEQFLTVMEYVSEFLCELSYYFCNVDVYCAPGNHSRLTPNKDQSLRGENMDLLALPYLRAKLQNVKNIAIHDNEFDEVLAQFEVRGQKIVSGHGDRTNMNNIVEKMTMYIGYKPDIIYVGHYHTNAMLTSFDTKVIQAGSFSGGGDQFVMDKMLRGKPEQVVSVISDADGLVCNYDIKLD